MSDVQYTYESVHCLLKSIFFGYHFLVVSLYYTESIDYVLHLQICKCNTYFKVSENALKNSRHNNLLRTA